MKTLFQPNIRWWNGAFLVTALFASVMFSAGFALADAFRGTLVHEATLQVSPDAESAKLGQAGRGHELVIMETSRDWFHVEAIIREPRKDSDEDDEESQGKTITGWILGKALVTSTTPNGDK